MATKIPYADEVLEVTGGCTKCSEGCKHCWAIKEVWRMAHNPTLGDKWQGLVRKTSTGYNWTGEIKCFEDALQRPLNRKKATKYFIDSKADLFHPAVPVEYQMRVINVTQKCKQHTFLILTKRIKRMVILFREYYKMLNSWPEEHRPQTPFKNIHLGVSVCMPDELWKIEELSKMSAVVRYVSFEPLLADMGDITKYLSMLNWVIIGCESINGWAGRFADNFVGATKNLVRQCKAAGVPVFVKQVPIDGKVSKKMSEWPKELQVQDYPILDKPL